MSKRKEIPIYISTQIDKESVEKVKRYLQYVFSKNDLGVGYSFINQGAGTRRVYLPESIGNVSYLNVKGKENQELASQLFNKNSIEDFNAQLLASEARIQEINRPAQEVSKNLAQWKDEIRVANSYGSSAIGSFWSVWSISWAIRGSLQDILGYSNKWVGEVNKLTRAFQSGLYLYAGTERIFKGFGDKILKSNQHYKTGLILQQKAAKINREILQEKAAMLTLDKKINAQEIEQHKIKIKNLQAQREAFLATSAAQKAQAEEETVPVRSALVGPAMTGIAAVSAVMALVGVIRWLQDYNEQVNKNIRYTRRLANELTSLGNTTSTVKIEFSDLNSLIDKVSSKYSDFGKVIENINDPFDKYAKTLAFIIDKSSQAERPTGLNGMLNWGADKIKEWWDSNQIGMRGGVGLTKPLNLSQINEDIKKYQALMDMLSGKSQSTEKEGFLNQLLKLSSAAFTKNIKNVDQLRESYKKYKSALIDAMRAEMYESYAAGINGKIKKIQADNTKDAAEKALILKSLYMELTPEAFNSWASQYLDNMEKRAEKALEKSQAAIMSIQDFYRQMYQAYNDAAKHDAQYQKLADYWKKKYIAQLKAIINQDLIELRSIKSGTEAWKQKNLELAKARQALADMLDLSQKLKSTWWNIPTAVIRPTQSQLTTTMLLQPQFTINANTVDEIKEAVGKQLENYTWKMSEPTGTEGGAL